MARLEAECDVERHDGPGELSHDELVRCVAGKDALVAQITDKVDRAVVEAGADLRIIANVAVGYNNVDAAAARERGIILTNTPDVLTGATADLTWALILAVTRRLGEGERMVRRNAWPGWAFDQLLGMELRGKQLGIIGYGRIAKAVAARAEPFGMRVAYVARSADDRRDDRRGGPSPLDDARGALSDSRRAGPPEPMPLDRLLSTS